MCAQKHGAVLPWLGRAKVCAPSRGCWTGSLSVRGQLPQSVSFRNQGSGRHGPERIRDFLRKHGLVVGPEMDPRYLDFLSGVPPAVLVEEK